LYQNYWRREKFMSHKPIEEHSRYYLVDGKTGKGEEVHAEHSKDRKDALLECFSGSLTNGKEFLQKEIPPRESILSPWLRNSSIGFIFGRRGTGKTWFAWKMAIAISRGENFGPWECGKPWKTLYVDGEMPEGEMQKRLKLLDPESSENLHILSHEALGQMILDTAPKMKWNGLNLCESDQQEALLSLFKRENFKIVFFDNISCLCFGMKENEADSWEQVDNWFKSLRTNKITPVIIHRANREGKDMRGTSKREDPADWIIRLAANSVSAEGAEGEEGTSFYNEFTKNRDDGGKRQRPLNWTFATENGRTLVDWKLKDTKELVYELIKQGVESNSDIAQELDISTGTVSIYAAQLIAENLVRKQGSRYVLYCGK
jgi:KaiC/GvpD/RAD55 family RecA-like ATPase